MAYDQTLAERIRKAVARRRGVTEKAMFGGVAFLLEGKMFCGIVKDELLVRVGPENHDDALSKPRVRTMDFTGRPMRGYVFVAAAGLRKERALGEWVERGRSYVASAVLAPPLAKRRTGRVARGRAARLRAKG